MVCRLPVAASLLLVAFCQSAVGQSAVGSEQGQLGIFSSEGGSCGYEDLNNSAVSSGGFAGSINSAQPLVAGLPSTGCGSCVQVTCNLVGNQAACKPGASPVILIIMDSCSSCEFDAPVEAFDQIADNYLGSINVQAQLVPCPATGPIVARILEYRPANQNGSYIKLVFLNVAGSGSLRSVQLRSSGPAAGGQSAWIPLANTWGAVWEGSQLPQFPADIQLTNADNQSVIASSGLAGSPAGDISLGVQITAASGQLPSPASAPRHSQGTPLAGPSPSLQSPPLAVSPPLRPLPALPPPTPYTIAQLPISPGVVIQPISSQTQATPFLPSASLPIPSQTQATPFLPSASSPTPVLLPPPTPVTLQPLLLQPSTSPLQTPAPQPALLAAAPPEVVPAGVVRPVSAPPPPVAVPTFLETVPPPSPLQVAGPVSGSQCRQINDWLAQSPSLQAWYSLLQSTGYTQSLAQPNISITMFAPINEAFSAPVFVGTTVGYSNNVTNVSQLLAADPSSAQPIIGYHILTGDVPYAQLTPGRVINTTDDLKQFGENPQTLTISIPAQGQVKGIGSTANIIDPDLPACGPSVLHVMDTVLLPFAVNSTATSASPPLVRASSASPPAQTSVQSIGG